MPLYRVVCDNVDILDYASKDLTLLAPDLELEINTAGSLEFTMPPYHKYYDNIRPLLSTIEVYEDDELIWFGRPTEVGIDFFKQKRVYCEGPLSFFNDSVQRPEEFNDYPLHDFFSYVISRHNEQMTDRNRQFYVGTVEIENKSVYRKLNYESTYQVLTDMCLNAEDGYFFFRRENGVNRIDWVKNMPYTCNQPIQFGLNLLNYKSNFDATDYATCIIPLGANDKETGKPITVANANNGSDVLRSDAISTYGPITKVQTWSDIKDPYALWEEGTKYLENTQFNSLVIECSAADLHSKNIEFEMFKVGQMARCISIPHFIDSEFPISKMSLRLDSAAKVITLGILKRRTLTRIYKEDIEEASGYDPTIPDSDTPINPVNPGDTEEPGDEWEIIWPEDPGEPVTGQRLPTKITVATLPNKHSGYKPEEDLDFAGLQVNIWTQDKDGKDIIWTNPPRYIDGRAPRSELTFSMDKAPKKSGSFEVQITWKYKGKNYTTKMLLSRADGSSWTANHIMDGTGPLGTLRGRNFVKSNPGKAIAVWVIHSNGNWEGPCLISDKKEAAYYQYSGIVLPPQNTFVYQGITFYMNTQHWFSTSGAEGQSSIPKIDLHNEDNSQETRFRLLVQRCNLQVI